MKPLSQNTVQLIVALLPAMTAVVGGLWVAFTYVENQRQAREQENAQAQRENRTRLIEAQKPFSSIQLALFMEAGKVAGELAAFDKNNERWMDDNHWKTYYTRFYELYWSE